MPASLRAGVALAHGVTMVLWAPACGPLEQKPCRPGCVDEVTRLTCDASGNPHAEPCPASAEPCARISCSAGTCGFSPAVGASCGADGMGRCNEGYACLGQNTKLSSNNEHTCALADDGKIWCWGNNRYRQLADRTIKDRGSPVPVRGLPEPAIDVSAAYDHTCAVVHSGVIYCWGYNEDGRAGPTPDRIVEVPTAVEVPGVRFTAVRASSKHTCGLSIDGTVYCWGNTVDGQCGIDGEAEGKTQTGPNRIPGVQGSSRFLDKVRSLETVMNHTCAIRTASPTLVCWGSNRCQKDTMSPPEPGVGRITHQLGPAATKMTHSATPVPVDHVVDDGQVNPAPAFVDVGVGLASTYAVGGNGTTYAWGLNDKSQLGTNLSSQEDAAPRPVQVDRQGATDAIRTVADVLSSIGGNQCAKMHDPALGSRFVCWGKDDHGELGFGSAGLTFGAARPASILGLDGTSMARGEEHTCVVFAAEAVTIHCYGAFPFSAQGSTKSGPDIIQAAKPVVWNTESYSGDLDDLAKSVLRR